MYHLQEGLALFLAALTSIALSRPPTYSPLCSPARNHLQFLNKPASPTIPNLCSGSPVVWDTIYSLIIWRNPTSSLFGGLPQPPSAPLPQSHKEPSLDPFPTRQPQHSEALCIPVVC